MSTRQTLSRTVSISGTITAARCLRWSAERLAQCFHDMPLDVAQDLLDYKLEMDEEGNLLENHS